jgi:hypothetical protein
MTLTALPVVLIVCSVTELGNLSTFYVPMTIPVSSGDSRNEIGYPSAHNRYQ